MRQYLFGLPGKLNFSGLTTAPGSLQSACWVGPYGPNLCWSSRAHQLDASSHQAVITDVFAGKCVHHNYEGPN